MRGNAQTGVFERPHDLVALAHTDELVAKEERPRADGRALVYMPAELGPHSPLWTVEHAAVKPSAVGREKVLVARFQVDGLSHAVRIGKSDASRNG